MSTPEETVNGIVVVTLRDYFAAQVLDMCAHDLVLPEQVAARAYAIADAMLKERAK